MVPLLLLLLPVVKLDAPSFLIWPVVLLVDVLAIGIALLTASLVSIAVVLLLTLFVTACWILKIPAELSGWTGLPGMLLVIGGFLAKVIGALLVDLAAVLMAFWVLFALFTFYFFRDPKRVTPLRDGLVVAPADGRISLITKAVPPPAAAIS